MMNLTDSERWVAATGTAVVIVASVVQSFRWFKKAPLKLDPWEADIDAKLETPEVLPLCHRCLTPHAITDYFCPDCGASVGDYNNFNPVLGSFSLGELMRDGTFGQIKPTPSAIVGYFLLPVGAPFLGCLYALTYWVLFLINLFGLRDRTSQETLPPTSPPVPMDSVAGVKKCPWCGKEYPNDATLCSIDHQPLR